MSTTLYSNPRPLAKSQLSQWQRAKSTVTQFIRCSHLTSLQPWKSSCWSTTADTISWLAVSARLRNTSSTNWWTCALCPRVLAIGARSSLCAEMIGMSITISTGRLFVTRLTKALTSTTSEKFLPLAALRRELMLKVMPDSLRSFSRFCFSLVMWHSLRFSACRIRSITIIVWRFLFSVNVSFWTWISMSPWYKDVARSGSGAGAGAGAGYVWRVIDGQKSTVRRFFYSLSLIAIGWRRKPSLYSPVGSSGMGHLALYIDGLCFLRAAFSLVYHSLTHFISCIRRAERHRNIIRFLPLIIHHFV